MQLEHSLFKGWEWRTQQSSGLYRQKWTYKCLEAGRGFSDVSSISSSTFEFKQAGEKIEAIFLSLAENWGEGGKVTAGR